MKLKCDYDHELPADLGARLQFVARVFRLNVQDYALHKTRRGYHLVLSCRNRRSPVEIVLMQSLLGSDWKREAFNGARVRVLNRIPKFWRSRWNVLYVTHTRRVSL